MQVIPHVTNEIKAARPAGSATACDVVITEIGGTVGDIEGLPFLEAIRQFALEVGRENALFIHVTLVPYINAAGELEDQADAAERTDDAVFITPAGVKRGKDGIREAFTQLLADVPNAAWELKTQIYEYDVLFLEWAAVSAATKVEDGIDTFVFRDGLIQVQTVRYTVQRTN